MHTPRARAPAVAGAFYPADPDTLRAEVDACLRAARGGVSGRVKAVIAPHAGYVYSGGIAGSAFAPLAARRAEITRVVLLGPSHHVAFDGLALADATTWRTPLGEIPGDTATRERLLRGGVARVFEPAHRHEHSLEVELPFLQRVLGDFCLVPLVTGDIAGADLGRVLDTLWGGAETVVVVSSDLTHFLDAPTARAVDTETAEAIERLDPAPLGPERACGWVAVSGLLHAAARHRLHPRRLDLRNSGDTAGDARRVVGYGAWAFTETAP